MKSIEFKLVFPGRWLDQEERYRIIKRPLGKYRGSFVAECDQRGSWVTLSIEATLEGAMEICTRNKKRAEYLD